MKWLAGLIITLLVAGSLFLVGRQYFDCNAKDGVLVKAQTWTGYACLARADTR